MYHVNRKWKYMPDEIPDDQLVVYCRSAMCRCSPFQAKWDQASQYYQDVSYWDPVTDTWIDTDLAIPWFAIDKWRLV